MSDDDFDFSNIFRSMVDPVVLLATTQAGAQVLASMRQSLIEQDFTEDQTMDIIRTIVTTAIKTVPDVMVALQKIGPGPSE